MIVFLGYELNTIFNYNKIVCITFSVENVKNKKIKFVYAIL